MEKKRKKSAVFKVALTAAAAMLALAAVIAFAAADRPTVYAADGEQLIIDVFAPTAGETAHNTAFGENSFTSHGHTGTAIRQADFGDNSTYTIAVTGNYYLGEDVAGQIIIGSDVEVSLCLNGYTLTANDDSAIYMTNAKLSLFDDKWDETAPDDRKKHYETVNQWGPLASGTTIDTIHFIDDVDAPYIIGGLIHGMVGNGGAVYVDNSDFTMYGGSILDCRAGDGASGIGFYSNKGNSFTLIGGRICDSRIEISCSTTPSTFNITGGKVEFLSDYNRGGIKVVDVSVFDITGTVAVNLSGDPKIDYMGLKTDNPINVGALSTDALIGIACPSVKVFTENFVNNNPGKTVTDHFFAAYGTGGGVSSAADGEGSFKPVNYFLYNPVRNGTIEWSRITTPLSDVSLKYNSTLTEEYYTDPSYDDGFRYETSDWKTADVGTYYGRITVAETDEALGLVYDWSFTIVRANNALVQSYSRNGWIYGTNPADETLPIPLYGNLIVEYYTDAECKNEYTDGIDRLTPAGTYYVKLYVEGTKQYSEILLPYSETQQGLKFTVSPSTANAWGTTPTIAETDVTYGTPLRVTGGAPTFGELQTEYAASGGTEFTAGLPTAAGEYDVRIYVAETNSYNGLTLTVPVTIAPKAFTSDMVGYPGGTFTYNGGAHTPAVSVVDAAGITADDYTVAYENNTAAGTATIRVTPKRNYAGNAVTRTFTIGKATYKMSGVTLDNATVTYDGQAHNLEISGELPAGVEVEYVNNGKTNAGTYNVRTVFTGDTDNYNAIADMTATLTITKATYDMSGVTLGDATATYDGQAHSLAISGTLPEGVTVTYTNNGKTNAGTYEVTAKFTVADTANYNVIADKSATLTITKATYDMSGVTLGDATATYDGQAHSLAISGTLPEGVTVTYTNNGKTNAGTYEVTAKFTVADTANYNVIADKSATLTITKATYDMSGVTFTDASYEADGQAHSLAISGTLPTGVTVTYTNNGQTAAGTYEVTATFTGDSANYNSITAMKATLTIEAKAVEPEQSGCGGMVLDGVTIGGIALAALAVGVILIVRRKRSK